MHGNDKGESRCVYMPSKQRQVCGAGQGIGRRLNTLLDRVWTDPLPIYMWVIEHPKGIIVVDTGETDEVQAGRFTCRSRMIRLFLQITDLVILKEGTPGTTAEHERLHECPFGLDGMVQIVSGPGMQHLCQSDSAQFRVLFGPPQVIILQMLEQDQAVLTRAGKRSYKLLRGECIKVCVLLVWIKIDEILSGQKSMESDGKDLTFRVH